MAVAASEKGLKLLGITEHAPGIPGTCSPIYFRNLHVVPRRIYGVELLLGAELNIIDYKGTIDLGEEYFPMLDIRIAGIHSLCYKPGTVEQNTEAMIGAIRNPHVHIISHPGDGTAEVDFEPIVLASKEHHTLLEINNSSLNPVRKKLTARDNNLTILRLCKKYEVPVILGSDAHILSLIHISEPTRQADISFDIARYDHIYELLQETRFPEELILNDKVEAFKKFIGR